MRRRDAFDEKIQYWFETLIGKGTFTMIFLLFLVTILFTGIVGVVAASVCGGNSLEIIWDSLMHTLDSGVLAGDSLDDKVKIAFMTIMTVFGLCFTSVLIGIVNSCFEK